MMHIGLIIYDSLDTLSGGYLYDRQLLKVLRNAGDTVEIISLIGGRHEQQILHNYRPSLEKKLRRGRYDVILQDELNHPSLYLLNERLRGRSATPIVTIVHHLRSCERHPAYQQVNYRRIEQRYLRSVDGRIYNSETTKRAVETLAGDSLPFVVAYPAADHCRNLPSEQFVRQ